MLLEYVLMQNGLEPGKDVEIINNIAFSSTSGAFVGNVGDFTVEFEPTATALEDGENGYVVASLGQESGFVPYTVYMSTKEFIATHPEVVQKFTNAIYKGQQWVHTHTSKEIAEVIASQFIENDIETLERIIERYKSQDSWKENPIFEPESFELIQDIMEAGNGLPSRVPYEKLIYRDFAEKAVNP